jgi:dolichol-phosphate mannosyltransferase
MKGNTVVLLPTYNERNNVARIIPEIFATTSNLSVLVIDDSSPDGTAEEVQRLMSLYSNLKLLSRSAKEGLGAAYKAGMEQVLADPLITKVLTMDADGSHATEYLQAMLAAGDTHDLVIGSRYVPGGGIENWEKWRYLLSQGANLYARLVTGLPVNDLTAGFACYRADLLRKIDFSRLHTSGYAFQIEIKHHAVRTLKGTFTELPIIFRARREGESKLSRHIIREGLKTPWKLRFAKK